MRRVEANLPRLPIKPLKNIVIVRNARRPRSKEEKPGKRFAELQDRTPATTFRQNRFAKQRFAPAGRAARMRTPTIFFVRPATTGYAVGIWRNVDSGRKNTPGRTTHPFFSSSTAFANDMTNRVSPRIAVRPGLSFSGHFR